MASAETGGRLLLITGAAGRIGSFYRRHLHASGQVGDGPGQWRLRLTDVRQPEDVDPADELVAGQSEVVAAAVEPLAQQRPPRRRRGRRAPGAAL